MQTKNAPLEIEELGLELTALLGYTVRDIARIQQIEIRAMRLQNLKQAPRQLSLSVLFLTAYAQNNRARAEEHIEAVLELQRVAVEIMQNALTVYQSFGSFRKAVTLMERMIDAFPDTKAAIQSAMMNAQFCCQLSRALELEVRYMNLSVNDKFEVDQRMHRSTIDGVELLRQSGLNDSDILARVETAVETVRGAGREVLRTSRFILDDGSYICQLYIDASPTDCAELSFLIADALVEQYADPGASVLSISCRPFSDFLTQRESEAI